MRQMILAMNVETVALGVLLILTAAVVAAVQKVREQDLWLAQLRGRRITELEDPLGSVTDGLTGDEMHRILVSVAAEAREAKWLVMWAMNHRCYQTAQDGLQRAGERLAVLIRCVESLCERLQPCITEGDGRWEMGDGGSEPETVVLGKKGGSEV